MKIVKSLLIWAVFITAIVFCAKGCHVSFDVPDKYWLTWSLPTMPAYLVVPFAFSLAFGWVEVLKWGSVKPFNCVKCLTGWFSLLLALCFHSGFCLLQMSLGLFVGAMYSAIKMRWL